MVESVCAKAAVVVTVIKSNTNIFFMVIVFLF